MAATDIPANLLSLGAIDFGIIVDGAIVVLENVLRRREEEPLAPLAETHVREAALQVARPMFFATAIIITAYLPLFAFQRVEKKLFTPMAYTVGYALFGAALLVALALIPGPGALGARASRARSSTTRCSRGSGALRSACSRGSCAGRGPPSRRAWSRLSRGRPGATVGREFLPELDEGSHLAAGDAAPRDLTARRPARWRASCAERRASSPR